MSTTTKAGTQTLEVVIRRVRHTSEGFSIFESYVPDRRPNILAVKAFAGPVREGQRWVICGKEITDPKWGRQFQAAFSTLAAPTNARELELFITSGLVDGWDWRGYQALVQAAGTDHPTDRIAAGTLTLETGSPITPPMLNTLYAAWHRGGRLVASYAQLTDWGVTGRVADALVAHYGADVVDILTDDPYQGVLDVAGYGWKTAEGIASWLEIAPDDVRRITAGLALSTHNATWAEGHTWLTAHAAALSASKLLGLSYSAVVPLIDQTIAEGHVVKRGDQLYPAPLDRAEDAIVTDVLARVTRPGLVNLQRTAGMFERTTLDALQLEAVLKGLTCPISLLTGGPGTGKTTCLKTLIETARRLGLQVTCMAPTGKAAARMAEATGYPASTIHSKLRLVPGGTDDPSMVEPLPGLVIVDEISMLDTQLAASMLRRIALGAQIVLVGDPDQLPSVGPGAVLRDLIEADVLPRTHLDHVYRNEAGIAVQAARIRAGDALISLPDCELIPVENTNQAADRVRQLVEDLQDQGVDAGAILVLTPTNDGDTGRLELCRLLQAEANAAEEGEGITQYVGTSTDPDGTIRKRKEEIRHGDPVMVTRNNRELEVFNGQVGRVTAVHAPRSFDVEIDGRTVIFAGEDKRSLTLAYALTGHKAQGSEAPIVIAPIFPSRVLSREWLYTVITRAKEKCYLIGDVAAMQACLSVQRAQDRHTGLVERFNCSYRDTVEQQEAI